MIKFTAFLTEESTEDKLKHLEHPEDHPIKAGEPGFHHAFNTLKTTAETLHGHDSGTKLMTKFDGAPSVVFGHHPETGRFFVASKSAFNANPKINYSETDIERNHGHAPGLVSKLKAALKHLPKVAPKNGVYQGDFLYNKADKDVTQDDKGGYHFKPQLIGYEAPKNSPQHAKIAQSKMGFYVHTAYKGNNLENMKADYTPDTTGFKQHPDVHMHLWHEGFDAKKAKLSDQEHGAFKTEMNKAGEILKSGDRHGIFSAASHVDPEHMSTYINKSVVQGEAPSVEGLSKHIQGRGQKKIDAVKTDKAKAQHQATLQAQLDSVKKNKQHIASLLQMHQHLQNAKNALLPALTRGDTTGYKYSINGQPSTAEGTVAVTRENRPTKLINRGTGGFSQANLSKGGFKK